jgi:hypothetical protein
MRKKANRKVRNKKVLATDNEALLERAKKFIKYASNVNFCECDVYEPPTKDYPTPCWTCKEMIRKLSKIFREIRDEVELQVITRKRK